MADRPRSFSTPRLVLRPWQESDREPFRRLNDDPEVMRHFPQRLPPERSDQLMERWQDHIAGHGWGFWAVERSADQVFIGAVGIGNVPFEASFAPAVEIGWRLLPQYWRQGYALEAAREALRVGFVDVGLKEIVAFTLPVNAASRGMMTSLRMRHAPADDFDHPSLEPGHPMRRQVLYRLQRADWQHST